jgi:hypothetical protein
MNTMAETVTIDRSSVVKPVSRRRSGRTATVSASALARHLDCSRTYIGKLEAEGVIQRQGDGSRSIYVKSLNGGRPMVVTQMRLLVNAPDARRIK